MRLAAEAACTSACCVLAPRLCTLCTAPILVADSLLLWPARLQVLRLLIRLYEECEQPDYVVICQCLMFLDDAPEVAKILNKLLSSGREVRRQHSSSSSSDSMCLGMDAGITAIPALLLAFMNQMQLCRHRHSSLVSGSSTQSLTVCRLLAVAAAAVVPMMCMLQDDVLLAYQIAFDLVDNELQSFIIKVGAAE